MLSVFGAFQQNVTRQEGRNREVGTDLKHGVSEGLRRTFLAELRVAGCKPCARPWPWIWQSPEGLRRVGVAPQGIERGAKARVVPRRVERIETPGPLHPRERLLR